MVGITGFLLFIPLVILVILVFEVVMFLDALGNPNLTDNERLLWIIGMLLIHPIVAIVYYFVARKNIDT